MIKQSKILCFVILALCYVGCRQPVAPDYRGIESIAISKLTLNESRVVAVVRLYNPNNFKLQMKHAEVNIFANDKFIGRCVIDSTIRIPRRDSFFMPVSVNINLKDILGNAVQLLLKGQVKINADGFVALKKTGIRFKVPIHYEEYQNLDTFLQQFH
jgi:LEA14-like dessication related protein